LGGRLLKKLIVRLAVLIVDGVAVARTILHWCCIRSALHFAVLHPNPANLNQVSKVRAIIGDELCDLGERLLGVDGEVRSLTIKFLITIAPCREVTTILVTYTFVAVTFVIVTTFYTLAAVQAWLCARVGCEGIGLSICLPDVQLIAA